PAARTRTAAGWTVVTWTPVAWEAAGSAKQTLPSAPPTGFEPVLHGSKGRRAAVTPGRKGGQGPGAGRRELVRSARRGAKSARFGGRSGHVRGPAGHDGHVSGESKRATRARMSAK